MKSSGRIETAHSSFRAHLGAALVASLALGLLAASSASAAYQQVGNFAGTAGALHTQPESPASWPEEVQLGGVAGMAVNYTGAGGVPAGTIYAAGGISTGAISLAIARYNPDRSFSERWALGSQQEEEEKESKGEEPYERCGPGGAPAHPTCASQPSSVPQTWIDVDIDQSTGNVYVFAAVGGIVGRKVVTVYTPDGSEVITRFAEQAASGDHAQEHPEKFHDTLGVGDIAVNGAGEVYLADYEGPNNFYHRLMVFKPKTPGDYSEYEYAGQSHDIAAGFANETHFPVKPVTDAAGYVYTAGEEEVWKYDPAHPTDPPICSFKLKKGGITGMTVNPLSGEVFVYSYVTKELHRLNPCEGGKFSEAEAIEISPRRNHLTAMAVDPVAKFEPARDAGILYAGAPDAEEGLTKGTPGNTEGESSMGYVFAPPNEAAPVVVSESLSAVSSTSARLEGQVDPKGNPTNYRFQYISEAAYQANEPEDRFAGASEAPTGGARIEGSKVVPVAATVSGLSPGAQYRFRILAVSHCASAEPQAECKGEGAGRAFRTYPVESSALPDHRAYELVSPAQKNGGQVLPANPNVSSCGPHECKPGSAYNHFPMQSTPDGNAIAYEGTPFSFDEGAVIEDEYIARRGDSGWHTANPTPDELLSKGGGGYQAFTPDLATAVLEQQNFTLAPSAPLDFTNLYVQPSADPATLTPLLTQAPPNRPPGSDPDGLRLLFAGASEDFSRLFFSANDALTPDAQGGPEAKTNLYESSGGALALVNLAPGGASTLPNAVFGSGQLLGTGNPNNPDYFVYHAISKDGSRAFWTSEEDGHLYVREAGQTRQVPDPGSCAAALEVSKRSCFITASADGSRVLLSDGLLFDVTDLAAPPTDLTGGKGGFAGIAGQSEDLSRVYFVDTAVLTGEAANSHGDKAQAAKPNLYSYHEGQTTFIATLAAGDKENWQLAPVHRSAAASPDGRWLAFVSTAPLTGFENTGPCIVDSGTENFHPGPCREVFLYAAQTGELRCPSCNRAGAPPRGPAHLLQLSSRIATLPPPRYLSDSGRLFFDSQDSLSASDTNGRVEDVYEFEPAGVGGCESPGGCVRLISAGRTGVDSNFLTMDPSGKNAFFTTRDQLLPQDKDQLIDLYDAREGGGFPPEARPVECQGEACLPSVSAPSHQTPSSASYRGPANPIAAKKRCPKGRQAVRRKGKRRCVKRAAGPARHRQKRQRRDHTDRGGAK